MSRKRKVLRLTIGLDDVEKPDDFLKLLKEHRVAVTSDIWSAKDRDAFGAP
jgi:hypothetical protein